MTEELAIFPDWSPYQDLDVAARAYLRDPDVALAALEPLLRGSTVLGFTLERFVNELNAVWQEAAICDGSRLLLWHGEDLPPDEGPPGAMTSAVRVIPLSAITEVGYRRRLVRENNGSIRREGVDVYVLLTSLDEAVPAGTAGEPTPIRHDSLRFGKTTTDGGPGQMDRLEEFAHLLGQLTGRAA
ncbi:hypothetical protein [Longispora albida]|uniref:hypothetical protein n=1 Tax=Longispora albida TaxID=203523 RepID=UPI00035D5589|nr:hypothetical protein [Longispora albida]